MCAKKFTDSLLRATGHYANSASAGQRWKMCSWRLPTLRFDMTEANAERRMQIHDHALDPDHDPSHFCPDAPNKSVLTIRIKIRSRSKTVYA
jgi:hypothetical protein